MHTVIDLPIWSNKHYLIPYIFVSFSQRHISHGIKFFSFNHSLFASFRINFPFPSRTNSMSMKFIRCTVQANDSIQIYMTARIVNVSTETTHTYMQTIASCHIICCFLSFAFVSHFICSLDFEYISILSLTKQKENCYIIIVIIIGILCFICMWHCIYSS